MRKLLISFLIAFSLSACGEADKTEQKQENSKPVVKIGVTLPLTGNLSTIGEAGSNAVTMVMNKWKQKNTKYDYQVVVEDDGFDAKRVAMIANRFVSVDKVRAILSVFSIGANVVSPITEKSQTLHLTCAYGSDPARGFYNFNNHTQYHVNSKLMVETLKKQGIKHITVLTQNNIGSLQQTEDLLLELQKDNTINVIDNVTFNPQTHDFRMILQKTIAKGIPDIFYIDGINTDAVLVAKTLKELTGEIKLTTINDFIEPQDKNIFNGLWFVESSYGTVDYRKEYKALNGKDTFICGANTYDNLDMLIEAFETAELKDGEVVPSNETVATYLLSVHDRPSAIGKITVDAEGIVQSDAVLRKVNAGQVVTFRE